jgi:hypothetical protein
LTLVFFYLGCHYSSIEERWISPKLSDFSGTSIWIQDTVKVLMRLL